MAKGVFDELLAKKYDKPEQYLTPRVQYFCRFYASHANASQAIVEAGYNVKNIAQAGQKLLENEYVRAYINNLSATLFDKIGMTRGWLAKRYKEIIDVDITDIYNEDGTFRQLSEIPKKTKRAIARIKVEELYMKIDGQKENVGRTVDVLFYDKLKAIDGVARMAGYNEEKSGVNINNSNVQLNFNDIRIVQVTLNI